jgi:hypothetical protein
LIEWTNRITGRSRLTSSGALSIRCQADLFSVTATSTGWRASSSLFGVAKVGEACTAATSPASPPTAFLSPNSPSRPQSACKEASADKARLDRQSQATPRPCPMGRNQWTAIQKCPVSSAWRSCAGRRDAACDAKIWALGRLVESAERSPMPGGERSPGRHQTPARARRIARAVRVLDLEPVPRITPSTESPAPQSYRSPSVRPCGWLSHRRPQEAQHRPREHIGK